MYLCIDSSLVDWTVIYFVSPIMHGPLAAIVERACYLCMYKEIFLSEGEISALSPVAVYCHKCVWHPSH